MAQPSIGKKTIKYIAFNLFVLFAAIYLLTVSGINCVDVGQARIEVARSIVERFDLAIPSDLGMRGSDGRMFSWFGIGSVILALPFYLAGKVIGVLPELMVSIMNPLVGAATVVVVFLFCIYLGYSNRASLAASVFYGLGTGAWYYAKDPGDHAIETLFILLSVFFMYRQSVDKKTTHLLYSSLFFGIACITRITSIIVILPLFILMIYNECRYCAAYEMVKISLKKVTLFSIALLPFLFLILWYNYYRFGSILESGYMLTATRTGTKLFSGTSFFTGLTGLLISPGKGYLFYSPVAVLFFLCINSFRKKHPAIALCFITIIISYILFFSKYVYWHGDIEWGPRYIFVITPFLMIPIAGLFDSETWGNRKRLRIAVYSLFAFSMSVQVAATAVFYQKYFWDLKDKEHIKFVVRNADGVQPIISLPTEIYFDWRKSPIVAHFRSIIEIARNMRGHNDSPAGKSMQGKAQKLFPYTDMYDFRWMYKYYLEGSYSGFVAAICLVIQAILCVKRLAKVLHESAHECSKGKQRCSN